MASTRLVTLGYVVLAIYAFIESRQLLQEDGSDESGGYAFDGSTLYVPLVLCVPANLEIQGQIYTVDASDGHSECRQMDYLINACASSLLFSAAGGIVYLFIDCLARYGKGPFNMSSANGMALFFIFILTQAGICTGALVEQTSFWVEYFQLVVDKLDNGIDNVESYADKRILRSAAVVAFGTALLIFLDAMVYRCYGKNNTNNNKADDDDRTEEENNNAMAKQAQQTHLKLEAMEAAEKASETSTSIDSPAPTVHVTPSWSSESKFDNYS